MTPTSPSTIRPRRGTRTVLAASGASLLLAAGGLIWVQGGAGADPVSTDVPGTCSLAGNAVDVTVPMTVDDLVDPIAPGQAQTLHVDQGLGQLPVEVTVDRVVVTTPIPAQVASTDSVTFEGGNMAGSHEVVDGNLVVTFTGPQSSSALQFPRVVVGQTIGDAAAGSTIEWKVWSSMVVDTNFGQATCTPSDPGMNLNTTAVSGEAGGGEGTGGDGGTDPTPTVPDPTTPPTTPTTPPGGEVPPTTPAPTTPDPTTPPTTPPAPAPGVSVEVCVTAPSLPLPCPITVPPSGDGGLPVPSLPVPGLPSLPVPPTGGGLPELPVPALPLPTLPPAGGGGVDLGLDLDLQIGASS